MPTALISQEDTLWIWATVIPIVFTLLMILIGVFTYKHNCGNRGTILFMVDSMFRWLNTASFSDDCMSFCYTALRKGGSSNTQWRTFFLAPLTVTCCILLLSLSLYCTSGPFPINKTWDGSSRSHCFWPSATDVKMQPETGGMYSPVCFECLKIPLMSKVTSQSICRFCRSIEI